MRYRKNLFNKECFVLFENELKDKSGFFGKDEFSNSVIVKSSENLKGRKKSNWEIPCISQKRQAGK